MAKLESLGIIRIESLHYYVRQVPAHRGVSSSSCSTSPRSAATAQELTRRPASAPASSRRAAVRLHRLRAGRPTAAAPAASLPAPRGRRHADLRGRRTPRRPSSCSTSAAAPDRRHAASRTTAARSPVLDHHAVRRHDLPLRRAQGLRRLFPGFVPQRQGRPWRQPFGFTDVDHVTSNFQTMAPARCGWSTCWASSSSGRCVPHHATWPPIARGLGPQVDRAQGSRTRP